MGRNFPIAGKLFSLRPFSPRGATIGVEGLRRQTVAIRRARKTLLRFAQLVLQEIADIPDPLCIGEQLSIVLFAGPQRYRDVAYDARPRPTTSLNWAPEWIRLKPGRFRGKGAPDGRRWSRGLGVMANAASSYIV